MPQTQARYTGDEDVNYRLVGGDGEYAEPPIDDNDDNDEKIIDEVNKEVDNPEEKQDDKQEPVVAYDDLPEEFRPPEFQNAEEETEWLREAYKHIVKNANTMLASDDTLSTEEADKYKAIKEALDGNPEVLFKIYFKQDLINRGHLPYIDDKEKQKYVVQKLIDQFGEDYDLAFNAEEAKKANTLSNKMYLYQNKLIQEIEEHNKEIEEQSKNMPSREDLLKMVEDAYENEFKSIMSREEYDKFVEEGSKYKSSIMDVYRMMNFDKFIEQARQEGILEGRRTFAKGLEKAGAVKYSPQPRKVELPNDQPRQNIKRQNIFDD